MTVVKIKNEEVSSDFDFLNENWVNLQIAQQGIANSKFANTKDFDKTYGKFPQDAEGIKVDTEVKNLIVGFETVSNASSDYGNVNDILNEIIQNPDYLSKKQKEILPNIIWLARKIRDFSDRLMFTRDNIKEAFNDNEDIAEVVEYLLNNEKKGLVINAKNMHDDTSDLVKKIAECSLKINSASGNIQPYYDIKGNIITYLSSTLPDKI